MGEEWVSVKERTPWHGDVVWVACPNSAGTLRVRLGYRRLNAGWVALRMEDGRGTFVPESVAYWANIAPPGGEPGAETIDPPGAEPLDLSNPPHDFTAISSAPPGGGSAVMPPEPSADFVTKVEAYALGVETMVRVAETLAKMVRGEPPHA